MMRAPRSRGPRPLAGDRDGFTLVEVLVVMVIITIGILPLAMVQTRARQEVSEADRFTQAMNVAQEQLEWTKGMGYENAIPGSGTDGLVAWNTAVEDLDVGLRRVTVTVVFPQGNQSDTLRMAALLSIR